MSQHASLPAWRALTELAATNADATPRAGVLGSLRLGELLVDFSRQPVDADTLQALLDLAGQADLATVRSAQFRGEHINRSEDRAVLHSALRAPYEQRPEAVRDAIQAEQERLFAFAAAVRSGAWRGYTGRCIRTVVHIGIGGSHLGPELVHCALRRPSDALGVRFLANLDGHAADDALHGLDPETTLFIVASKSFGTLETRMNAQLARSWLLERMPSLDAIPRHFVAITTNLEAAAAFGLPEDNLFALWDWVGGRYSLWSAIGLPLLLAFGEAEFGELLAGAHELDQHFQHAPLDQNLPVLMALVGIWNYNFLGAQSLAVLAYDRRLRLLPDFLQQLEMESNGKSVDLAGNAVGCPTMPVLWGGEETNGQHAFHQLLHQGNRPFTADFIGTAVPGHDHAESHSWQLANLLAQAEAMEVGDATDDPARRVAGARATTTILLDAVTPRALGGLIALYEQKVFCQGVLWGINSFDQWGVELGKRLADGIAPALQGQERLAASQATSQRLIDHIRNIQSRR